MKEKIMFDELVDDIVNRIDPAGHNTDGLKKHYRLKLSVLVNQEVEKRIAERMPSEAEKRAKARHLFVDGLNVLFACEEYDKWLRSRLVSQKTEGGGE